MSQIYQQSLFLMDFCVLWTCPHYSFTLFFLFKHSVSSPSFNFPLPDLNYTGTLFSSFLPSFLPSFISFVFLGPYLWHMEVPRLGVELELQPPAYTTATARWDPSHICNLHHRSRQCWIFNPLSKARGRTCALMDASQIHFH